MLTMDQRDMLDGILLHAGLNLLTAMAVTRIDTNEPVALLCCHQVDNEGKINVVPVAELIIGIDVNERYIFPDNTLISHLADN